MKKHLNTMKISDWLKNDVEPLISIGLLLYNHEKYVEQSLNSILEQECSQPVELIIVDDCSTDNTIRLAEKMLPNDAKMVTRVYHQENQYSKKKKVGVIPFLKAKGKYVTVLDGDDFWSGATDRMEQMSQSLERNDEAAFCFTNVEKFTDDSPDVFHPHLPDVMKKNVSSFDLSILNYSFIHIGASLFRNVVNEFPEQFYLQYNGDTFMPLLWAKHGYAEYLPDAGKLNYRVNENGAWSGKTTDEQFKNQIIFGCQVTSYLLEQENLSGAIFQGWRFAALTDAYKKIKWKT